MLETILVPKLWIEPAALELSPCADVTIDRAAIPTASWATVTWGYCHTWFQFYNASIVLDGIETLA
jgi:hypothetical protein